LAARPLTAKVFKTASADPFVGVAEDDEGPLLFVFGCDDIGGGEVVLGEFVLLPEHPDSKTAVNKTGIAK